MTTDIRWQQRFDNFQRAYLLLKEVIDDNPILTLSDLEQEGLVQRFEYTYELAWKTMKDYLECSGIVIDEVTPRNVIKEAFAANIIDDGQLWIDMLQHRNKLSYVYDSNVFKEVLEVLASKYIFGITKLYEWLNKRIVES